MTLQLDLMCEEVESGDTSLHHNANNLLGLRFGRLLVVSQSGTAIDGHMLWKCLCDCGNFKSIASNSLTRKKHVKSCGCMNKTAAQSRKKKDKPWNVGKTYIVQNGEKEYKGKTGWAKAALRFYGSDCQRCGWNEARCDVHHRIPKSEGGLNIMSNAIVLCPNCHRLVHEKGLTNI